MSQKEYIEILFKNISKLEKALNALLRSKKSCLNIEFKREFTDDELDKIETLTSRFARIIDLLINKVFRSIDYAELENSGTTIDVLNRAEKRGILKSIDEIKQLKELRNLIAHEYADDMIDKIFKNVMNSLSNLEDICKSTINYCNKYKN